MTVYFTSDQHFGHAAARSFYRRPFSSITELDRVMIDRWNAVVEPGDERARPTYTVTATEG
jgi:calcineurin-like phosphoesterase family protein